MQTTITTTTTIVCKQNVKQSKNPQKSVQNETNGQEKWSVGIGVFSIHSSYLAIDYCLGATAEQSTLSFSFSFTFSTLGFVQWQNGTQSSAFRATEQMDGDGTDHLHCNSHKFAIEYQHNSLSLNFSRISHSESVHSWRASRLTSG